MKRVLSWLLLCVTLLSGFGCTSSPSAPMEQSSPTEYVDSSGFQVTEPEGSPVRISSVRLSAPQYADYSVSSGVEAAYVLTATVEPFDAAGGLDWSLGFVNPLSEWAMGQNVEEFVKIEQRDELEVVVTCVAPFGERIQVVTTSKYDPSISATCMLDYAQRVEYYKVSCGNVIIAQEWIRDALLVTELIHYDLSDDGELGGAVSVAVRKSAIYTVEETFVPSLSMVDYRFENSKGSVECVTYQEYSDGRELVGLSLYFDYKHLAQSWYLCDKVTGEELFLFQLSYNERVERMTNLFGSLRIPLFSMCLTVKGIYSSLERTLDFEVGYFL